ncbi:ribonucleotide reductase subunit alpha [Deefgea salmonis]|uniref:Ribonucleotide reductase subunit alpha n=1 Tax=Deefgea salmonis TaxID=2875502 RepID=A0ABS8BGD3_9NEIS|nr:ribonucleotide reductase subunit alpha [Deefgea salmonis]MCB5194692.1 ribonucleotide reductase subunit alpha [Deefgea salmonis]
MNIASFTDLLTAARAQPTPQRLLFVFTGAGLPEGASAEQVAQFTAQQAGELTPLMYVDKSPLELSTFAVLTAESTQLIPTWDVVFVAGLGGKGQLAPTHDEIEGAFQRMMAAIQSGAVQQFLAFRRNGELVQLIA